MRWRGVIKEYRNYLPVSQTTPIVSLCEGNTPLVPAPQLGKLLGDVEVFLKLEGSNPTGSFKDRGMTMAVSKAQESGAKAVICASTGNTSASAAAYAARAGMRCAVLIPEGAIALGKLAQALLYGAQVIAIQGNFDDALRLVRELTDKHDEVVLVNSVNPFRIEGQKTGAFEIVDALQEAPDFMAIPVGNAGNITAYWKGYQEYCAADPARGLPKLLGFQAAGAAPIVRGTPVAKPETVATAIRIGNPASWQGAENAIQESGGLIAAVTDEEIITAYQTLARTEGIFVEPASAACVAGVLKLAQRGFFRPGQQLVCILTGHGLKDPQLAIEVSGKTITAPAEINAITDIVLGGR